uniref:Uncharacterized protein n=1 Tax=Panagrolaimus superbus TaxID=310955 RepID=A0A914ZAM8_9BILA
MLYLKKQLLFLVFPDVFELCTPELKERLAPNRAAFKEYEDKAVEILRQSQLDEGKPESIKYAPFNFDDDPGSNNSGFYELQGMVTYKSVQVIRGIMLVGFVISMKWSSFYAH